MTWLSTDMQSLASSTLSERVKRLDQALEPKTADFKYFIEVWIEF